VLRYLSDAFRAIERTVPERAKTPELAELIDWLGELVRQIDSSLLDEFQALSDPATALESRVAGASGGRDTAGVSGSTAVAGVAGAAGMAGVTGAVGGAGAAGAAEG